MTHILSAVEAGDPKAAGDLLPPVSDELRKLALRSAYENPRQTLLPTALVHEAYLHLVGVGNSPGIGAAARTSGTQPRSPRGR